MDQTPPLPYLKHGSGELEVRVKRHLSSKVSDQIAIVAKKAGLGPVGNFELLTQAVICLDSTASQPNRVRVDLLGKEKYKDELLLGHVASGDESLALEIIDQVQHTTGNTSGRVEVDCLFFGVVIDYRNPPMVVVELDSITPQFDSSFRTR
jgi:hypothetical protein